MPGATVEHMDVFEDRMHQVLPYGTRTMGHMGQPGWFNPYRPPEMLVKAGPLKFQAMPVPIVPTTPGQPTGPTPAGPPPPEFTSRQESYRRTEYFEPPPLPRQPEPRFEPPPRPSAPARYAPPRAPVAPPEPEFPKAPPGERVEELKEKGFEMPTWGWAVVAAGVAFLLGQAGGEGGEAVAANPSRRRRRKPSWAKGPARRRKP